MFIKNLKFLLAALFLSFVNNSAVAQGTATPSVIGYLSTSGCPTGQTVCFVQYGATVPTTGGGGGGGNVNVVSQSAGLAQDTSLTQIQQTHASVAGNGTYILDPSTGLPITYTAPTNTNTAQVNGVTVLTGTGAVGTGAQRIAVGTDTATIAGSAPNTVLNNNTAQVNGVTTLTGTGATGTGAQRMTVAVDSATVAGSASLPAGTNLIGKAGIDQTTPGTTNAVQNIAGTAGGLTSFTLTAANSTNATNVKGSAGNLYHIAVYNNSATLAWVSFYNTAGTPTCGSSIVYQTIIAANSTSGAGAVEDFAVPLSFSTGIGICVATGIAGTGSVAASAYVIGLGYK